MTLDELLALPPRHPRTARGDTFRGLGDATMVYPLLTDPDDNESVRPAVARAWSITKTSANQPHTVVVAVMRNEAGEPDWRVWCADDLLERVLPGAEINDRLDRLDAALGEAGRAHALRRGLSSAFPASAACHFRHDFPESGKVCKHVVHIFDKLFSRADAAELLASYDELMAAAGVSAGAAPEALSLDALAARVPVMLAGDQGAGKTTEVHDYARRHGLPVVIVAGHDDLGSSELLGHMVNAGDRWLWKDGRLAQAFRMAAGGQAVVLLIDEILRIPQRQLSVLLTALSPIDGRYHLPTGRMVDVAGDVGREETLSCPAASLRVIATTNVGSRFAVDAMDPAFAERWVILYRATTEALLRERLGAMAAARGFSAAAVEALVRFYKKTREQVRSGQLAGAATLRTLARAMDLADREADIPAALAVQRLQWVALDPDGAPVPEQVTMVDRAVAAAFARAA